MESQMKAMAEYDSTMTTLQSRIGETAPALYGELQNMNVDQIETLKTIAAMSDEELQYYVSLYDAKQMFAEDRAKRDNEELKKQTDEQIEELKTNADNQINELEKKYKKGIKKIGNMGEKEFKKAGKQSVEGMGVGMNTAFDALEKQMMARARALVAAVQATLRIHSPSRVFADEVGKFIPLGIAEGVEKAMPTAERSILSDIEGMKNAAVDVVGSGYTSGVGTGANSSPVTMLLAAIYDAITGMPDDMTQSFGEALTNTTFSMNDREFARLVKAV
jgi:ribosomal protein L31E